VKHLVLGILEQWGTGVMDIEEQIFNFAFLLSLPNPLLHNSNTPLLILFLTDE
jgi:hypothetical protein